MSYDDVLELAKQSGMAIYTISLRAKAEVLRASRESHRNFSSSNPRLDGRYRRVIVRVTAKAGARTRTRSGYLAARAR